VTKIIALASWACGGSLILGLGNCEPHIPVTVSAEGAEQQPYVPDTNNPIDLGRLQDCSPGTADCDRDHANGCEATLADDPKNCGVCGTDCSVPNTDTGCMGGTCRVVGCSSGYCDEDGEAENGCEVAAKSCKPKPAPRG
jgi:hypothetical protein